MGPQEAPWETNRPVSQVTAPHTPVSEYLIVSVPVQRLSDVESTVVMTASCPLME